ncbi:hypothetical protein GHK86_05845 [Acidimicrobiaceae bacterium USS-CC1]|uniref:Uncharacterized protein n=1 Tax=Acidiferrimicrobium australe TaxID=2664430 RepID=A0ABW9QQY3_9ACTN|nr:hypothetical protein [Acidiferrimicrobium australe]
MKAGVVAGTAVWVAPAVESFVSPAAAASGPTTECLTGIASISWLALIIKQGGSYYIAKIDPGSSPAWGTATGKFPCGKHSFWKVPDHTYQSGAPSGVTVTATTSSAVTVNVASGYEIVTVEAHGGAGPRGGGSICVPGPSGLTGPGTFTFVPCTPTVKPE